MYVEWYDFKGDLKRSSSGLFNKIDLPYSVFYLYSLKS